MATRDFPVQAWKLMSLAASLLALLSAAVAAQLKPASGPAPAAQPGAGSLGLAPELSLLRSTPFDRITLVDGSVLRVEPLTPRPLPPYDPEKDAARRKAAAIQSKSKIKTQPPPSGNIGTLGQRKTIERPESDAEELPGETISIHLLEGDLQDFLLKRIGIRSIEYFEDLLLAEANRLIRRGDFTAAFDYLLRCQARDPKWKGLAETYDRLLFEEGVSLLSGTQSERGLRLLRDLSSKRPSYPGLAEELARAYGRRIDALFLAKNYSAGRRLLFELEKLSPNNSGAKIAREQFAARAKEVAEAAEKSEDPGEGLDSWRESLRIWPLLEGGRARHDAAFSKAPTLDVGVTDEPGSRGLLGATAAAERISALVMSPILAGLDEAATTGQNPEQLAAGLETTQLGRSLTLTLREHRPWSDGSRSVLAIDVAWTLAEQARPESPLFRARWAQLLDRIEIKEERQIEIRLRRQSMKPEVWLQGPALPAQGTPWGAVRQADGSLRPIGDGPYRLVGQQKGLSVYKAEDAAAGGSRPRIARVLERLFTSDAEALAALTRGDVALIDHVPLSRLEEARAIPGVRVGAYERPVLHRIALDGRNPALRLRTLRRGLSLAIDRKALLEEIVLKGPSTAESLVSDGPFPRGNYADAPDVKPLEYDPLLARMLVSAARKELGEQPIRLKFEYPRDAMVKAVAPRLIEAWTNAGVVIEASERPAGELEDELASGRRFDLAYRATASDDPVFAAGPLICPGYDASPAIDPLGAIASPRILQLLLMLEAAADPPTANPLLLRIDRESRDELPILPLWQTRAYRAWRDHLTGPAETARHLYERITSWEIRPWLPPETE